jgi:hypothetical protein
MTMTRLKEEQAPVEIPTSEVEKPMIICGVDVTKLTPYTTEDELPPPTYRTKTVKGRKVEQIVEKGAPRYYTQGNGTEMVEVRRGFHRVERRWFCRIRTKLPNWKPFIEEIRRRGIREVF